MLLSISINPNSEVEIILKKGEKFLDKKKWRDKQNLSSELISQIDQLLLRNGFSILDLKKVEPKIEIEESYSTYRIGMTVAKTINFYCKNR